MGRLVGRSAAGVSVGLAYFRRVKVKPKRESQKCPAASRCGREIQSFFDSGMGFTIAGRFLDWRFP